MNPAYFSLVESGALAERVKRAYAQLNRCITPQEYADALKQAGAASVTRLDG